MVESDRYIVERILDHKPKGRGSKRGTKRLVKYKGYEEPEWQDARAFLHKINEDWSSYSKHHELLDRLILDHINGFSPCCLCILTMIWISLLYFFLLFPVTLNVDPQLVEG